MPPTPASSGSEASSSFRKIAVYSGKAWFPDTGRCRRSTFPTRMSTRSLPISMLSRSRNDVELEFEAQNISGHGKRREGRPVAEIKVTRSRVPHPRLACFVANPGYEENLVRQVIIAAAIIRPAAIIIRSAAVVTRRITVAVVIVITLLLGGDRADGSNRHSHES